MKIYLFPFLIDLVMFLVMLRLADAAGREMKLSNLQISWLMVSFSAVYLVTCLFVGRLLHRGNARRIFVASICLLMGLAIPLFFANTFWMAWALFSLLGIALALAFNSLQTFIRGEAPVGSLGLVISRYTVSWSLGVSCGFLFGGVLKDFGGPLALAGFTVGAGLTILLLVFTHKPTEHESSDAVVEEADASNPRVSPVDARYVVIGWLLCLVANFSQRPLTTFIPKFHAENNSPAWLAGCLLFTLYFAQAISGYACPRLRPWLYRRGPLLMVQLLIVVALACLWKAPNVLVSFGVLLLLGLLFGFVYFCCVYYVSNDARSSRNVGINEAMVGAGNILGMLISEWSMRIWNYPLAYFPVCMGLTLLLIGVQWAWLNRQPTRKSLQEPESVASV
ncbi:MAG TPA: MFS transporter [Abditibacteriaceae bacterium]|jgi:MFS family permease